MAAESDPDEEGAQRSDPVQAFDDLRAEVAELRQVLQALPETLAENQPSQTPDYSEDLGRIVHQLSAVAGRLDAIEKHPALRLTPDDYRQAVADAGDVLMRNAARKLGQAAEEARRERDRLAGLIGAARSRGKQRSWLLWTGLATLIAGLLLAPFVARVLPLGLKSGVAAFVMKADRWNAGMALMEAENPEGWRGVVDAAELCASIRRRSRRAARRRSRRRRISAARSLCRRGNR